MAASDQSDFAAGEGPLEIAIVGDLSDAEGDVMEKLLSVSPGGECVLYFDSPGGSAYVALAITTLLLVRQLKAEGIVIGECSSAALWPLAACRRRVVTPLTVLLFHPMRWQSEERVGLAEAAEWARHFGELEKDMDTMLANLLGISDKKLEEWTAPGRYVSGREFHQAGLAELVDLNQLAKRNS